MLVLPMMIVAIGMALDILSCYLFLRRNRIGVGASGQPLATMIVCFWLP